MTLLQGTTSSPISQEIEITIAIDHKEDLIWPADVDANADTTVTILHQDNDKIKSDVSFDYSPRAIFQLQQCQNRYDTNNRINNVGDTSFAPLHRHIQPLL